MSQLLLLNPRRRRRASSKRRRSRRRMSALQRKYFGGGRVHRRRARRRTISMLANPRRRSRRRQRGYATLAGRRRYRRAFASAGRQISASIPGVVGAVQVAAIGAAGAIAVDMAMGQAGRFLPATLVSRYNADGTMNWGYYGAKAALAVGLAVIGQRALPGALGKFANRAAEGALLVMAYEILRSNVPASWTLGYFNPATVTGSGEVTNMGKVLPMGKYLSQRPNFAGMRGRGGMGKYLSNAGGSFWSGQSPGINQRTGEGPIF